MLFRSLTLAVALTATGTAHGAELNALETACALEAASAFEPGFETTGKTVALMDAQKAIDTCFAALGYGDNYYRVSAWLARGYYAAGSYQDALYYAERAAQEGVPLGQYIAGVIYSNGEAGDTQPEYGLAHLIAAAEVGFVPAYHALAINLINGTGVEQELSLAIEFLSVAADEAFGPAATTLGMLYYDGLGVEKDDVESARLLRLARHYGDADGVHELALYAEYGVAGPVDKAKAAALHEEAIGLGSRASLTRLAKLYIAGEGVAQDMETGRTLLQRAATRGDQDAAQLLSLMVG